MGLGILAIVASAGAFSRPVRQEIGERDNWTCQNCGKRFQDGWMVQAAHYDHDKRKPTYDDPNTGRILCTLCHIQDELDHGNTHAAALLRRTQTIRTWSWTKNHKR